MLEVSTRTVERDWKMGQAWLRRELSGGSTGLTESEHYRRAKELFLKVCDLPVEERNRILDEACADDITLRLEVESLLRHNAPTDATPPASAG